MGWSSGGGRRFRIGLFIPLSGAAGLWGPSSIACAQLAVKEINASDGIAGREVELLLVDAAGEAADSAAAVADQLIDDGAIDAIVGMHISAVRQSLARVVGGRVPYVYTPLYEGNETTPGVFAIGETSDGELRPAIARICALHRARRWALIGNAYVWPRMAHQFAKKALRDLGCDLVMEEFTPFGAQDPYGLCETLSRSGADAVLLCLIGQDAVDFNRAFGNLGLDRRIVRLASAFEENGLLATGRRNAKRLYATASYFGALPTRENQCFREKYHSLHGEGAPMLNALGQSLYEGTHFLRALAWRDGVDRDVLAGKRLAPLPYLSARGAVYTDNTSRSTPVYLARADGHVFDVVERLT